MSFLTKQDYCGLATSGQLEIYSTSQNNSIQTVTAQNKNGDIIADEIFGESESPNCEYKIVGNLNLSSITLGSVVENKYVLSEITFGNQAGGEGNFSAKCEQVEDDASADCTYPVPTITMKKSHHAQIVWNCVEDSFGNGVHLQSASYTATCTLTKTDVNGVHKSHGISAGLLTATLNFKAVSGVVPTVTPGEGWSITTPVTETNPDSDYPTYTVTLTKYLTGTHN